MTADHAGFDIMPGRPGAQDNSSRERLITGERVKQPAAGSAAGLSQELLRRYLLTRALGSSIRSTFQWAGVGLLAVSLALGIAHLTVLAVLVFLLAVGVLVIRALLSAIQHRLSGASQLGPYEQQVQALVGQTRRGLRHELRRVGLPGAPWGPVLIALRLLRRGRRAETLAKMTKIDLLSVVPQSRVDELSVLLGNAHR